jgi:CTP:molybdopterin cytidylyltransferase MocA
MGTMTLRRSTPRPSVGERVHGLLLAAGEGRRMGMPKALVRDDDGTSWLHRSLAALREGGCDGVTVVLGAGAAEARLLLDGSVGVVIAGDWAEGMGASLRTGLRALGDAESCPRSCVVSLVDLPDVGPGVVARLVAAADGPATLARASYDGEAGHPVVLGRDHWAGVVESASGDRGARDYLAARQVTLVECGDLAGGRDQDSP